MFTETTHQRRQYLIPSASELIIKIVYRKPKNRAFAVVWMVLETNAQALFSNSLNIIFQQLLDTIVQKISMTPFWVRNLTKASLYTLNFNLCFQILDPIESTEPPPSTASTTTSTTTTTTSTTTISTTSTEGKISKKFTRKNH